MDKYYRYPPQQISGFYCFIADKPKRAAQTKKPLKRRLAVWQHYMRVLVFPGNFSDNSESDSKLASRYV